MLLQDNIRDTPCVFNQNIKCPCLFRLNTIIKIPFSPKNYIFSPENVTISLDFFEQMSFYSEICGTISQVINYLSNPEIRS